jgi:glycosyltransferase involved in cell wall biosynthesis
MNRPDVTLVIIGRRPAGWLRGCWTPCRRAARPFGPRVLLLDRAPRPHVTAAYRAAGVLASGSAIEAFPLVILEAMAAGLPFVAFPAGNTADLPGGVIVTSAAEMAAALDRLLNADAERAALGAAGRSAQRARYEWDAVVDRYEALYTELLARPRRAAAAPFARGAGRA